MTGDIVERIREAFRHDTFWDTDAPPLLDDAVAEIVTLRRTLMELAAQVRMAETLDEAVASANKFSPINVNAVLLNGFHMVDLAWRKT